MGSSAAEACELAAEIGLVLDPWERLVLDGILAEDRNGDWLTFENAVVVARQNGKGAILEVRELAGLFLFGEQMIIHSAHETKTSKEAFRRMETYIRSSPALFARVGEEGFKRSNEEVSITLRETGARIRYLTRSTSAGRGFSADLLVLDESYNLPADVLAAILPVLSARSNAQVIYASSAGRSTSHVLWALRKRALTGTDPSLFYAEWTAEAPRLVEDGKVEVDPVDPEDRAAWLASNPSIGVKRNDHSGLTLERIENEYRAMASMPEEFAIERLGVWEPIPDDVQTKDAKMDPEVWKSCAILVPPELQAGHLALAFDVTLDAEWATIVACYGSMSHPFVDIIEHQRHVGWLGDRLADLVQKWQPVGVACNGVGPAAAQVGPVMLAFDDLGVDRRLLHPMTASEYKRGCEGFLVDVNEGRLQWAEGQEPMLAAGLDAVERRVGESWLWGSGQATVPLSPLVGATMSRQMRIIADQQSTPGVYGGDPDREQDILDEIAREEQRAFEAISGA